MSSKFIIITLVVSVAILAGGAFLAAKKSPQVLGITEGVAIEFLDGKSHDWGKVDINGGKVEKTFRIKSSGGATLEINNFKTSCMCTETQIKISGQGSPVFGMHAASSWKGVLEPNEEAEIKVVFDPIFHGPTATGNVVRLITFNTNDANNENVELRLIGNVVAK